MFRSPRSRSFVGTARFVGALVFAGSLNSFAAAGDWLHWRGPTGNGTAPDAKPPIEWGESKNLRWKVEIPGNGSASPIIVGNRVFIATAVEDENARGARRSDPRRPTETRAAGQEEPERRRDRRRGRGGRRGGRGRGGPPTVTQSFTLLCLDRKSGDTLWTKVAAKTVPHEGHHGDHGFASASPCSDGERVYTHFGSRGLFCYDLAGKLIWEKADFGKMETRNGFGEGSSPTVYKDVVIVPWDHQGPSYLVVLDKKTGDVRWRVDRDEPTCWATPLVVEHNGKEQIIVSGENHARGYDLKSGDELWRCSGQTGRPVASPVAGHGLAFVGSGFRGSFLGAFRLGARGDLKGTDGVAWQLKSSTPDIPSPLLSGTRLYFHAARKNIISCYDAPSGEPHYGPTRVEGLGDTYASPIAANGYVYLTDRSGTTVVIKDADKLEIVATNELDEGVDATPAPVGNEMFVRGRRHLYCFGS